MPKPEPSGRLTLQQTEERLDVVIVPERDGTIIVFLGFCLCWWASFEFLVVRQLLDPAGSIASKCFLLVWFAGWSAFGVLMTRIWTWNAFGRETITVRDDQMVLRRSVGPLRWERRFDTAGIRFLCYNPPSVPPSIRAGSRGRAIDAHRTWPDQGVIECGYDNQVIRFGCDLDPFEGGKVVKAVRTASR